MLILPNLDAHIESVQRFVTPLSYRRLANGSLVEMGWHEEEQGELGGPTDVDGTLWPPAGIPSDPHRTRRVKARASKVTEEVGPPVEPGKQSGSIDLCSCVGAHPMPLLRVVAATSGPRLMTLEPSGLATLPLRDEALVSALAVGSSMGAMALDQKEGDKGLSDRGDDSSAWVADIWGLSLRVTAARVTSASQSVADARVADDEEFLLPGDM
eukprot:Skav217752  [mRNA]  locus=scaffold974:41153:46964:+ [translate_table: standard]